MGWLKWKPCQLAKLKLLSVNFAKGLHPRAGDLTLRGQTYEEAVDKSVMIVVGGFAADAFGPRRCRKDRAGHASWWGRLPRSWPAKKKKDIITASFDAFQRAMQLFRSLRTNPVMKFQNPWVAENWPRSERTRGKVVSKSKNLLVCEIGCVEANDVKVNYKLFKVRARVRVACWVWSVSLWCGFTETWRSKNQQCFEMPTGGGACPWEVVLPGHGMMSKNCDHVRNTVKDSGQHRPNSDWSGIEGGEGERKLVWRDLCNIHRMTMVTMMMMMMKT